MDRIEDRTECPKSDIKNYWAVMTFYERFEHIVSIFLSFIISIVIIFALLQLTREVINVLFFNMLSPLDHKVFQLIFGMIMTLLIAMEFKHSILKVLDRQSHIVQAKGVVMIALLALTRKLIIIDLSETDPSKVFALGFVVLALAVVYYLLKRDDYKNTNKKKT